MTYKLSICQRIYTGWWHIFNSTLFEWRIFVSPRTVYNKYNYKDFWCLLTCDYVGDIQHHLLNEKTMNLINTLNYFINEQEGELQDLEWDIKEETNYGDNNIDWYVERYDAIKQRLDYLQQIKSIIEELK